MKSLGSVCALAAVLLAAAPAQADPIRWSYSWSTSPHAIPADGSTSDRLVLPGSHFRHAAGSGYLASPILAFLGTGPDQTATFTNKPYTLTLTIHDKDSGLSQTATFTGTLNGTVSRQGSTLTNTLTSPAEQTLHIGHHLYDISLVGFLKPHQLPWPAHGPRGTDPEPAALAALPLLGAFRFYVHVHHNPEPSSLVLAGIAIPALAGSFWRRRVSAV